MPARILAAPQTVSIGQAQATLQFAPDPPQLGKNHVVVTLVGAPNDQIAHTAATFATMMPTMSMSGPHGPAREMAPGRWEFDVMLGMAAPWDISVHFTGGVSGTAVYHVTVGVAAKSSGSGTWTANGNPVASTSATTSMASTAGNPGAWRTATFALVIIFIGGLIAVMRVRGERRPVTIGIAAGAAILTLVLAIVQARYASQPMDMTAMSSVQGDAPTPVTVATVSISGADADPDVFAPGAIAPYLTQDIVPRASGILRDFSAYTGDHVQRGQTLATLEAPDVQSRAQAAAADASAQAASAQAAQIEARHQAPNEVVIARAETAAMERDLEAARAENAAKAEQFRYWENEIRREKILFDQGAVSEQEYQDETAQAAAARSAADAARLRISSLEHQIAASRTKALNAVANVAQTRAQAASAEAQARSARGRADMEAALASFRTIMSPSDGLVIKRLVDPGVYVQAGTPIARIAVVDRLRVQANVAQRDLIGISVGTPIEARLSDGSNLRGQVTSVSPVADPATHTATVEAIVTNAGSGLVPGGYVRVTFHARSSRLATGIAVPSAGIVGSANDAAVWIMTPEKTAHRVPVRVVTDDGVTATIKGDLQSGARVVIDGAPTLEEGQPLAEQRS